MSEEEIWKALDEWRNSEECKQIDRVMEIYAEAERIYQLTLAFMNPIYTYTTDSTKA